jgi:hypothetical protein
VLLIGSWTALEAAIGDFGYGLPIIKKADEDRSAANTLVARNKCVPWKTQVNAAGAVAWTPDDVVIGQRSNQQVAGFSFSFRNG